MKIHWIMIFALLLICTGAGAALAQTPDEETPSEETVCDGESGAAYGLCNAYCEAMDCDSSEPAASPTACTKVKDKFTQFTGRPLPCDNPCPCQALPEFNAVLAGQTTGCSLPGGFVFFLQTTTGFVSASELGSSCDVHSSNPPIHLSITPEQGAACVELLISHCGPAT